MQFRENGACMAAKEHFKSIARPSGEEFYHSRADIRKAMIACMTLYHTVDYIAQNRNLDPKSGDEEARRIREELHTKSMAFRAVEAFALASKHCRLGRRDMEGTTSGQYRVTRPSFAGVAMAGATFAGDRIGGVVIRYQDRTVNLVSAVTQLTLLFEAEFPELS